MLSPFHNTGGDAASRYLEVDMSKASDTERHFVFGEHHDDPSTNRLELAGEVIIRAALLDGAKNLDAIQVNHAQITTMIDQSFREHDRR